MTQIVTLKTVELETAGLFIEGNQDAGECTRKDSES